MDYFTGAKPDWVNIVGGSYWVKFDPKYYLENSEVTDRAVLIRTDGTNGIYEKNRRGSISVLDTGGKIDEILLCESKCFNSPTISEISYYEGLDLLESLKSISSIGPNGKKDKMSLKSKEGLDYIP